jgi:hypothetical protein
MRFRLAAYMSFLFSALIFLAARLAINNDPWVIAEWLINYQGGFVRRGLIGHAVLGVHYVTDVKLPVIVAAFCLFLYAAILYCVWRLLEQSSWKPWVIFSIVSPATLAFPILVPAVSGFHKEILFLAGLGALLLMLRRGVSAFALTIYLSLLGVIVILAHEPMAVYLPYCFAAVFITVPWRKALAISAIPALLSCIATFAVLTHMGDVQTQQKICASLDNNHLCGGAVAYIGRSKQEARLDVIKATQEFHYGLMYPVMAVLALLPIVAGFRSMWRTSHLSLQVLLLATIMATAGSIELFLYATDWGRWIHIHIFSLFLLLSYIDGSEVKEAQPQPITIPWYVVPYGLFWALPGYTDAGRFGYFSLCMKVLHHFI